MSFFPFHPFLKKSDRLLRLGIIGLGRISDIHIRTFAHNKNVSIESLADIRKDVVGQKASLLGTKKFSTDYWSILSDSSIDVVDILLPHFLHARVVCEALESGKHVICEKPLATELRDIDKIVSVSRKTKKHVYLKQYFRFSTLHRDAKDAILRGDIGRPYLVSCVYTGDALSSYSDPKSWRGNLHEAGGGIFMDVGVHIVDFLQELFGYPIAVTGVVKKNFTSLQTKGEDMSVVTLEFQSSIVVNIICSAADTSYGFRWEKHFYGSDGSLHLIDFGKPRMEMRLQKNQNLEKVEVENDWWDHANIGALNDCIERIIRGEQPAVSLQEAKNTLHVIKSAYKSAILGRKINL